jgi:EpsI family protein
MKARFIVLIAMLAVAGLTRWATMATPVVSAATPESLPFVLGAWQGRRGTDFSETVSAVLGVDAYINRAYVGPEGRVANVYVGYYRSQQQDSSIHSPLNCMPGAGWSMEHVERVAFAGGHVRRVVIRKGAQRLLVVYWYHTAGRIEGDEYRARLYSVVDTMRAGRNDAALVRVTVPIAAGDPEGEVRAARYAFELAAELEPQVGTLLFAES